MKWENVDIVNDYGYPLIRRRYEDGEIRWYYPEVPTLYQPDLVPRLREGLPVHHVVGEYKVATFSPKDGPIPPIVIGIWKLNEPVPGSENP